MMAEESAPPLGEGDAFTFLMDMLLDQWRRTGEVGGVPAMNEEEAIQIASEVALAQMQQLQASQTGGMPSAQTIPQGDNPLLSALRGGVR